jgi:predicted CopG family antitoxin
LCLCTQTHTMPTKTIGVKKETYERLAAEKRDDESFSDTIDRLVENARSDWRSSFGKFEDESDELRRVVEEQRKDLALSEAERQEKTLDEAS